MKVPSFITTLGMLYITTSLALVLNKGNVIWGLPKETAAMANGAVIGIPFAIFVMLVSVFVSYFVLQRTVFGVFVYAIGGNEEALKLSGRNSSAYKLLGYAYCGFFAALAGVVMTIRVQCAQPTVGVGMEFEAFSSCVLGGAIVPGRGSVQGALMGCLFIIILRNGLNSVGISSFYQLSIIGLAIIASIVITVFLSRKINGYV